MCPCAVYELHEVPGVVSFLQALAFGKAKQKRVCAGRVIIIGGRGLYKGALKILGILGSFFLLM